MVINKKITMFIGMMAIACLVLGFVSALEPDGPSLTTTPVSSSKTALDADMVNVSGGTINTINITGIIQNPRWKAFIGNVSGTFVLNDAGNNRIYDWSLATITGKVYSTRKTTTVNWSAIACATPFQVQTENTQMALTSINDNVSATFDETDHEAFYVGPTSFAEDQCGFALNTYVNNASQNTRFEEVLLHDQTSDGSKQGMVYTSLLEEDETGYDGNSYDFQMIVPERGSSGWTGSTAYYLYIEIGN